MSSLEQQHQKRPTLHFAADAGAGTGAGAETAMSGCSPATTPLGSVGNGAGFLPDMPQWKKDLIQRRKTNVARTNAAACSPTSVVSLTADGSCVAFTEPADSGATDATATATTTTSQQQQQQQKYVKRNVSQTQQQQQATFKTSPTEEKSEKCFIGAGGHHTLPAVTPIITTTTTATAQSTQGKDLAFSEETAASAAAAETTTTTTTTAGCAPIPKQRSSLFNTRSQSTSKEQEILNLDTEERERESELESERENNMHAEVNSSGMVSSGHNRQRSRASGEVETGTATAPTTGALTAKGNNGGSGIDIGSTSSGVVAATSSSSANQLQTKCKLGQSGAEAAATATATAINLPINYNTTIIIDKNCKSKISDKLQSNKFIQNQQQQQQQQQQQLAASPTKVAVKTTMVAMQEMKKTTQNGQHRHHHHHHANHHNQHVKSADSDVDTGVAAAMQTQLVDSSDHSEDLSYGPGIVSKLRCRYLNMALRYESQQQCQKQRLQRSTSLNTLLDRNDDDDEDQQQQLNNGVAPVGVVSGVAVQRSAAAAPPILSVKPTTIVKSVSVLQQQQQLRQQQEQAQQEPQSPSQQQYQQQQINGTNMRSRHFKRGNEVMKRARSVEALLCEKSPWNTQRASYQAATCSSSAVTVAAAASSPTCVTIEDKISNARERLHSGTDTAPPKRLTSIIDDTERPPPDLVKQTLKMFEASANRRPRPAQRSNGVGGVASKVANYKSIIKEQKPSHKREPIALPAATAVSFAASTPKQRTPPVHNVVPDIIPRQLDAYDSPGTLLSKTLERLSLDSPGMQQAESGQSYGQNSQRLVSDKRSKLSGSDRTDNDDVDIATVHENDVVKHADENVEVAVAAAAAAADIDDACNGDNMGAAGDKLTQAATTTTTTTAAAAGSAAATAQRSFGAALHENAHANSSRKLSQSNDYSLATITTTATTSTPTPSPIKQISVVRPLLSSSNQTTSSGSGTPLTSREIEKNRINEMKKSTALAADAAAAAGSTTTSLDTVINTKNANETDDANASLPSGISPIWLCKRRQPMAANTDSPSMVFDFSKSTKEVPDYIESDVVIYRRKRELPKPNEPGFVLLGDLSVETSTDTDYDDYSMCPPSPCDVEFENANIVIDGKSSIRQKSKDSSFRVQFNDTLTSTFEYPSEASQTIDDPPYADPYGNVNKHHQLLYEEQLMLQHHQQQQQQQQQQQHHHVTVDEIIELPTSTTSTTSAATASHKSSATSAMLGNLPLGSTALGFYTPVKASPMDSLFQLGVTRYNAPESGNSINGSPSNGGTVNGNGSAAEDSNNPDKSSASDELDDYLTADNGVVYSEGTQKTDLLY